jgi:TPP-dependent indolepyruvate ferredoxin oxidoreductase alpha subunit
VGRDVHGPAEKYRGKLVAVALAKAMTQDGIQETDAVANFLSCVFGTPTLEKGCPILGIYHDADSQARPEGPLTLSDFGCHSGPGRFDIGAWEHSYFVP